jgi:hypothetical protein
VITVHDDDLVADDEIHVTPPFGMDFDERRRNVDDAHTSWHRSADPDREVYVACARHVASHQDCLPDRGALLGRQVDGAAGTTLTLLSSALRRLSGLTLLALLTLRGLALLRRALVALGLRRALALVALTLAGALISLALTTLRLALLALVLLILSTLLPLTLSTLVLLRRLSCGLIPLTLTPMGLTLLLLRSLLLLRLAAATLRGLRSILARAAARRSLALRAGAGLSPARHVLG